MPIISVFFGIIVRMFYREHEPAHFHAEYQGQDAKFDLDGKMIVGNIRSKTARRLIRQCPSSAATGGQLEEYESGPSLGEDRAPGVRCYELSAIGDTG